MLESLLIYPSGGVGTKIYVKEWFVDGGGVGLQMVVLGTKWIGECIGGFG